VTDRRAAPWYTVTMAGWVERGAAEWTELRVHGVSGTPPESMLEHPTVRRVAGDGASGFYRRVWQSRSISADDAADVLEAYSWGGLTAGSKLRALWLLLLPFLLVNVAFYARPAGLARWRWTLGAAVQRLFALTITATLVLATVNISMDFAGWQCMPPGGPDSCGTWVGWLSWPWLATPARRIAVTALLPLAVIALLWWLAHKTWCDNEATRIEPADSAAERLSPLEDRRMWNSAKPVLRLRAVHVTAALALVGILASTPFTDGLPKPATVGTAGAEILLGALVAVALLSVVLVCLPSMSERPVVGTEHEGSGVTRFIAGLTWATVALDAITLGWLWFAGPAPTGSPDATRAPLPWLPEAVQTGIAVQLLCLIVMVVLLSSRRTGGTDHETPAAWSGYATAVFMLAGAAMSGAYAAAMVLAVAHLLGKPMPSDAGIEPLVTPMPYLWAAALAPPIALAALLVGGCGYLVLRRRGCRRMLPLVTATYPAADADSRRARWIARQWATAALADNLRRLAGWFVAGTALLITVACIGYLLGRGAITDQTALAAMANLGDWLIGLFAAGLLYLGRQSFQNANTRRLVGIIWDLGTFWPRAAHPLAPPCYAERAVPELVNRIDHLRHGGRDHVLLSCHSQGTVLGAAVIMQLTYQQSRSVALLTYGSPLRRLYARFFPVYFGVAQLRRTGSFLLGAPDHPPAAWPWRNLYRNSDPIGGAIFPGTGVDHQLVDPVFARAAGDLAYPPTLAHSAYPEDPWWATAVAEAKELRTRPG
jgi:hypothetical protein